MYNRRQEAIVTIPDKALEQHIAILGKTGSGKTYAAKGVVERLLTDGGRVCIIDPTGAWHGLRSSASGKSAGFPVVIFGGSHADLPLGGAHGEAIAEIIGTASTPAIIDTSAMKVGERTRFFADFADALVRKNKGPLHLIIDEAHLFAPQGKVNDPQSGAMLHAANNLVSLGRSRGLRIILITQRPAKLHKDSLTQVETLVALRLIAPQDRKAVEEWIKDNADEAKGREIISSLAMLKTGHGWVWAPEINILDRVAFPRIKTFDSSAAPDGLAAGSGPVLAPIDRDAIAKRLEMVAADALANDPARLKKEIAELKRQIATTPKSAPIDPTALEQAEQQGYRRGKTDGYGEGLVHAANDMLQRIDSGIEAFKKLIVSDGKIAEWRKREPSHVASRPAPPKPTPPIPRPQATRTNGVADHSGITGPQRQLLQALAWWKAMGHDAPTRVQVASIAGWRVTSGHLKNVAGSLRSRGLIDYPSEGVMALTPEGAALAPEPDTSASLDDSVRGVLTGPQRQVFDLLPRDGQPLSREQVAQGCGWEPTSGHVKNVLGSLRSLEVINYPQQGFVSRADWLAI